MPDRGRTAADAKQPRKAPNRKNAPTVSLAGHEPSAEKGYTAQHGRLLSGHLTWLVVPFIVSWSIRVYTGIQHSDTVHFLSIHPRCIATATVIRARGTEPISI